MKTLRCLAMTTLAIALMSSAGCDGEPVDDNTAPVANFTITPACTSSSADEITFQSTSTDADGDDLTCTWVFSSGNPGSASGCTVTGVTFPNVSPYNVILTVDDGNGGEATDSMLIGPC